MVARRFAAAWDAGDWSTVDSYVEREHGVWLLYNVGAFPYPYHYASVSAMRDDHFGYVEEARFECTPTPGEPPGLHNCTEDGEEVFSECAFGTARPVVHEAFDCYLRSGLSPDEHEKRTWAQKGRDRAIALESGELQFLSDAAWGAVFYFAGRVGRWQLVAISTADCSA